MAVAKDGRSAGTIGGSVPIYKDVARLFKCVGTKFYRCGSGFEHRLINRRAAEIVVVGDDIYIVGGEIALAVLADIRIIVVGVIQTVCAVADARKLCVVGKHAVHRGVRLAPVGGAV